MMETLKTSVPSLKMLLGTVSVSSVKWHKCRQLVSGLGVHSLHLSSGKQGRRFIQNLLQWRWTFLQLQHHRPVSRAILSLWIVNCSGRRNRMTRSLTVRVCLKINMGILRSLGVLWLTLKKKWMQNAYHNPVTSDW